MSLNHKQFMEACREWEEMDKRLIKLIGFNPATSNHYGLINLYNNHINKNTTDKEILEIQVKYVEWRKEILAFFKDNGYDLGKEEFSKLFSVVGLFGRVTFLDEVLDLDKETKYYFPLIESYIKKKTILKN